MKKIKPNQERRPKNWEIRDMLVERNNMRSCLAMRDAPAKKIRRQEEDQKNWRRELLEEEE